MLYFAYGSNMLTARLGARCRSARAIGRARAVGWRLGFDKLGQTDGSGKGALVPKPGAVTEGVLFHLNDADLRTLDRIEGVGQGYRRIELEVFCKGEKTTASSYQATAPCPGIRPYDWYLALVRAGAAEHGLSPAYQAWLARTPCRPDLKANRPGRRAALAAFLS